MHRLNTWACIGLVTAAALAGCGGTDSSRLPTAKVIGTVTVQGQPVTSGTITFFPVSGGKHALGSLGADGSFTLSTYEAQDGAVLGAHKVVIQVPKMGPDGAPVPGADRIPPSYAASETTPLTVEVKQDNEPLRLDLQ